MIEYALQNSDLESFNLNGTLIHNPMKGSLTLNEDNFEYDNKIVEKSALPGAVQLGERRIMSRNVSLTFSRAEQDYEDFKDFENDLLEFLKETAYLHDVTNGRRVPVAVLNYALSHDKGSYHHSSDNTIELKLLEPFWTSISATTISTSLAIDINKIAISKLGYLEIPPIITLTASSAVSDLRIYIDETKKGIQIEDNLFGTDIYTELILDCINGTLMIDNIDRINSVIPGTGFFSFPTYACTLIIIPDAICDVQIDRYSREYV